MIFFIDQTQIIQFFKQNVLPPSDTLSRGFRTSPNLVKNRFVLVYNPCKEVLNRYQEVIHILVRGSLPDKSGLYAFYTNLQPLRTTYTTLYDEFKTSYK